MKREILCKTISPEKWASIADSKPFFQNNQQKIKPPRPFNTIARSSTNGVKMVICAVADKWPKPKIIADKKMDR